MQRDKQIQGDFKKQAVQLIILFGLVSLFGDLVYEGGRSVNGPYLKLLGVNAATLGLVIGIGEFLGYLLRLLSGYLCDKKRIYWLFIFLGYGLLISIPLISLATIWQIASFLIILERIGKALRSPARDTLLSEVSTEIGTGFGFGLHEALDQIGAILGPLIFTFLFLNIHRPIGVREYRSGYSLLWLPFLLTIFFLVLAWKNFPTYKLVYDKKEIKPLKGFPSLFWFYLGFSFITTAGFCNFALLSFYFKSRQLLSDAQIPLCYALAMAVDAFIALRVGGLYDLLKNKKGLRLAGLELLLVIPLLSLFIPVFIFLKSIFALLIGIVFWGIVMGTHETIMRSALADIVTVDKRATAYGIFNSVYGLGFFLGSWFLGLCYDKSIILFISAIVILEIFSLLVFFRMKKEFI